MAGFKELMVGSVVLTSMIFLADLRFFSEKMRRRRWTVKKVDIFDCLIWHGVAICQMSFKMLSYYMNFKIIHPSIFTNPQFRYNFENQKIIYVLSIYGEAYPYGAPLTPLYFANNMK